jgi:hypothetical protein
MEAPQERPAGERLRLVPETDGRVLLDVSGSVERAEEIRRLSVLCAEHGAGEPFADVTDILDRALRHGLSSLLENYRGAAAFIERETSE